MCVMLYWQKNQQIYTSSHDWVLIVYGSYVVEWEWEIVAVVE
jgi:hypothetical protein